MLLRGRPIALVIASLIAFATSATAAQAHDQTVIREVFAGIPGEIFPDAEYVELQMYAPGQTDVTGRDLTFYDAAGALAGTCTFTADPPQGDNQRTILMATPGAEALFGVTGDLTCASVDRISGTAGAVCWEAIDCVSWGPGFPGITGGAPSPTGAPAPTLFDEALTRSIAPGCPTLLEAGDDTNDSATDFAVSEPTPRPNAVVPTETPCPLAPAPRVDCAGKRATLVGTPGKDVLTGTPGRDVIAGLGGADKLRGRKGKDILCGGRGDDALRGGRGRDVCRGGAGDDEGRSCERTRGV